jgi:SAM-dependent MidA family methyltransferase
LWELGVTCAADAGNEAKSGGRDSSLFRYAFMPLTDPRIAESLKADGIVLREDQEFEVNLAAERWISLVGRLVEDGALIIIDYGHEAAELAAPHRMRGTLLCYKEHVAHDDPFVAAGRQDITAHVNFSACRRAAEGSGWEAFYYDTQKQFLVDQGILNDLIAHDGSDPFGEAAKSNRAIRQLLLSDNMSEAFKVLALRKRREL